MKRVVRKRRQDFLYANEPLRDYHLFLCRCNLVHNGMLKQLVYRRRNSIKGEAISGAGLFALCGTE